MGYTHYFGVNNPESPEWKTAWPQLIQDVSKIIEASHVRICGPSPDDDDNIVTPPIVDIKDGIDINGVRKSGYEPFRLGADKWGQGQWGHFCKTSQKAYDEVVTCILLRAWKLAPNSDGSWEEWSAGRELYQRLWPEDILEAPGHDNDSGDESDDPSVKFDWGEIWKRPRESARQGINGSR